MESLRDVTALVGRILLALIFVYSGLGKIMHMGGLVAVTSAHFAHAGIPQFLVYPGLYLSAAVELGGGLLVIAGLKAQWAALVIFLWLIPVTLVFHFADYHQAVQQHQVMNAVVQQIMFLKNLAMMGGLLVLAAMGPGGLSIDGRSSATGMSAARHAA
jgi:putative oxidoreductase